jgi:hypothetical protein
VLVDSFETVKKAGDAANETLRRCLLEDVAVHRALAATRLAMEKQTREGRNNGAGPSDNK